MELTTLLILYVPMLGLILAALFVIMYRQGRSPTHNDLQTLSNKVDDTARQNREDWRREMQQMREEFRREMQQMRDDLRREMQQMGEELRREIKGAIDASAANTERQINELRQEFGTRMQSIEYQVVELRKDVNRALFALANHEHVNGRVMVNLQPEEEPAAAAAD